MPALKHLMVAPTSRRATFITLLAVTTLVAVYLARIDDWLYKPEAFLGLSRGLDVPARHPALVALSEAGIESCKTLPIENRGTCIASQRIVTQNLYFVQPVLNLFGVVLAGRYGDIPLPLNVHRSIVWAHISTALLAAVLWLLFTLALPPAHRALVSAAMVVLVLCGYLWRGESASLVPDPIGDGVQVWEAPVLLALAAVMILLVPRASSLLAGPRVAHIAGMLDAERLWWLPPALLAAAQMALPSKAGPLVHAAGFVLLLLLLARETASGGVDSRRILILVVLLLVLIGGNSAILLTKMEVPRYSAFLIFGAVLALVTVRPRSRLILALPVIVVFHASVSALLGLALACAEAPIALRRLRASPALLAGLLTFCCGFLVTSRFETEFLGVSSEALAHTGALLLGEPWRIPALIAVLALIGSLSLWPLLSKDPRDDGLVRVGVLVMEILVVANVAALLIEADAGSRVAPGYYVLTQAWAHLCPGIAFGASLAVIALLLNHRAPRGAPQSAPAEEGEAWLLPMKKVMILVLLIVIAKIDVRMRWLVPDVLYNTIAYVTLERAHPSWCGALLDAGGDDDHYLVSTNRPANGPENYFSLLKLKTRIVTGLHNPERMSISAAPRASPDESVDIAGSKWHLSILDAVRKQFGEATCSLSD